MQIKDANLMLIDCFFFYFILQACITSNKVNQPPVLIETKPMVKKEAKSSSNFFAMPSIPMLKKTATVSHSANAGVLLGGENSRVLKHSKSSTSSSSASSVVSGTGSTVSKKSSSRFAGFSVKNSSVKPAAELLAQSTKSSRKLKQFPPNPYHVVSAALPVSAQDSELQSVVSGDVQFEDGDFKSFRKMDNTRYCEFQIKKKI